MEESSSYLLHAHGRSDSKPQPRLAQLMSDTSASLENVTKLPPHGQEDPQNATSSSDAAEVERLRQELAQCQTKFVSWKERAKEGVDQLRAQIVDLKGQLEMVRREQHQQQPENPVRPTKVSADDGALTEAYLLETEELAYEHAIAAAELFVGSAAIRPLVKQEDTLSTAPTSGRLPVSPSSQEPHRESLQKTIKDQSDRLTEAQHARKRLAQEMQQLTATARGQEDTIATLKQRLSTLEATNIALQEQLMRVPNAEESQEAREELEHHLERTRREYEERVDQLLLQHHSALQALNSAHAQEIQEVQREASEAAARAVQQALSSGTTPTARSDGCPSPSQSGQTLGSADGNHTDDASYLRLLQDYNALDARLTAVTQERNAMAEQGRILLHELRDLLQPSGSRSSPSTADSRKTPYAAGPSNLESDRGTGLGELADAARHIVEQRHRLVGLQEELARARHDISLLKRARPSLPSDGLGSQQLQYLRSVVVQLLCSFNDASVAHHLLPVLSMLLQFTEEDLASIKKAAPHWSVRK